MRLVREMSHDVRFPSRKPDEVDQLGRPALRSTVKIDHPNGSGLHSEPQKNGKELHTAYYSHIKHFALIFDLWTGQKQIFDVPLVGPHQRRKSKPRSPRSFFDEARWDDAPRRRRKSWTRRGEELSEELEFCHTFLR